MIQKELTERILSMEDEVLKGIGGAVKINSVMGAPEEGAPFGPGPKKALEYALDLARSMGFEAHNVDDMVGYAEYGEGDDMVAVLGHLDVVPVNGKWDHDPFLGEVVDGEIYGRGTCDDKGMAIGALYALKAIKDLGLATDRRIRVIFGTNEESGSRCVRHYVESGQEMPVMGFTPDADFPLIFFEKGTTHVHIGSQDFHQGDIPVLAFEAGRALNVVPDSARLILEGNWKIQETEEVSVSQEEGKTIIEAKGAGAHGSMPELGKNALVTLLEAVEEIQIGGDFAKVSSFILEKIGRDTKGQGLGIHFQDPETGETSVNLGTLRLEEGRLSFGLDIRYPKNGDHDKVKEALESASLAYGLQVLDRETNDPLYVPKDSDLIQRLLGVYRAMTGDLSEPLAIGGGTYAKVFPNMVAFGPNFPGDTPLEHQPNERVEVKKLMKSLTIVGHAMLALGQETV
ncbi:dipeptidase PepV [Kallipyga massiliensis]|uniref:dipeptidase PepV n=1 Tax=Kallipyga massiliensis TaxID=1472764 RepID=UPI0026EE0094|nr:dipeptidase PepV [Kallipyga massiliensis]